MKLPRISPEEAKFCAMVVVCCVGGWILVSSVALLTSWACLNQFC